MIAMDLGKGENGILNDKKKVYHPQAQPSVRWWYLEELSNPVARFAMKRSPSLQSAIKLDFLWYRADLLSAEGLLLHAVNHGFGTRWWTATDGHWEHSADSTEAQRNLSPPPKGPAVPKHHLRPLTFHLPSSCESAVVILELNLIKVQNTSF